MRIWRTMFSISTMASSTRMPVTMVMASRLTRLSEPRCVERPEGWNDGERQGDGGDGRGAPVAQEDEHHDDGQDGALDHRLHRRVIGTERVDDHRVDLQLDVGVGLLQLVNLLGDVGGNHHVARSLGPRDGERHGNLPLSAAKVRGSAVASVTEPSWSSAPCGRAAARSWWPPSPPPIACRPVSDRLLAPANLAAPAGQVDVGGAQLPVDVAGGDAEPAAGPDRG